MKATTSLLSFLAILLLAPPSSALSSDSSLVGHWSFDDGTAADSSGRGNNGALYGCTPTDGVYGGALGLNGAGDYVDFGNPDDLSPTGAITIAAWFRPASFAGTGNDPILDKGFTSANAPYYQYHLGVTGDLYPHDAASFNFMLALDGQLRSVTSGAGAWIPGWWYHVAGTYDGSVMKLYVNGHVIDSLVTSGSMTNYQQHALLGRYSNNANAYLPGSLDDLRVYGRALS